MGLLLVFSGISGSVAQPIPLPLPVDAERDLRAYLQNTKLIAEDGEVNDRFGYSVALSDDGKTALIGASSHDTGGNMNQGIAYVFVLAGDAWVEQAQLIPSDGENSDFFGHAVALSANGDVALVGADGHDTGGNNLRGAAYVFVRNDTVWTQHFKLIAADGESGDGLGISVSLSADGATALVGAPFNDIDGKSSQGSAYIFNRDGANWVQQPVLTADDGLASYSFGYSVALSADGNNALITAIGDESAYIFTWNGVNWAQQGKLTSLDGVEDDQFGISAAISADGNTALVGANTDDVDIYGDQGTAYVFTRNGTSWTQQAPLRALDGIANDSFGYAVDLSDDGNTALIGVIFDDIDDELDQGSAYIFTRSGENWTQQSILLAEDGAGADNFGKAVSLLPDGNGALVSADFSNANKGAAYIFYKVFSTCAEVTIIPVSECNALVALYNSTGGANWNNNAGWLEAINPCVWAGVTCESGNVIHLNFASNNLVGNIPPEVVALTQLQTLNLDTNQLAGSIPTELGNLTNLTGLYLGGNQLTGSLPGALGNLTLLTNFQVHSNQLSGAIPETFASLVNLQTLHLYSNQLSGSIPATLASLANLTTLTIDYNLLYTTDPTLTAFLDSLNPGWNLTQTISPTDLVAVSDPFGMLVNWTPILYQGNGGYYEVECTTGSFEIIVRTTNKAIGEAVFSGLPAGLYTCSITTVTPAHNNNPHELTSAPVAGVPLDYEGQTVPPNDPYANPIIFDSYPQQNYSLNIENATRPGDPLPPVNDPGCPVSLPSTAVGIHYEIPGTVGGGTGGIVFNVGGPVWYSNRRAVPREEGVADTAVVIYEENASGGVGAIVACDDDNAPGEVSISNVNFDLDPSKTYRAVVWNEGEATLGAIVEIAAASFALVTPLDDSSSVLPPTTFTWEPYADAVSYYFKVARTNDVEFTKLSVVELTPAADTDSLTCSETLCTLTVEPESDLDDYLIDGNYLWSVGASMSAEDTSLPLVNSNQIFRFVVGIAVTENLLVNGNFETDANQDKQPDGWTVKNLSQDRLKCNKPDKVFAYEGNCAFVFKGSPNEIASIFQRQEELSLISGQDLTLTVYARGTGIVDNTKIIVKVKYEDNDSEKEIIEFGTPDISAYQLFKSDNLPITNPVASLKVTIKNRNLSGKLLVDDLQLIGSTDAAKVSSDPSLPLPPASGLTGAGQ